MVEIKINCENKNEPISRKGGWFDIPLPTDVVAEEGKILKLKFDLRIKMPEGYEAIIQPRSSTLERWGLISSGFGVIEDSYCGPTDYIGYRFYPTKTVKIPAGTYLVQMRFQNKMKGIRLKKVKSNEFSGKNRGGFGSTDGCIYPDFNDESNDNYNLYNMGFAQGHLDGYQDGYEEGFTNGYDQAINDVKSKVEKINEGGI